MSPNKKDILSVVLSKKPSHNKEEDKYGIDSDLLIAAYKSGFFPMATSRTGSIRWYSPDPRAIIPLEGLKISRSLKQTISKRIFKITVDNAFEQIIRHCADREDTWISAAIIESYLHLHKMGHAHSIESWKGEAIVGGLYGVSIGSAFFGESMFSVVPDASKIALVFLVNYLKKAGYELLDTQFMTPHLKRLGAVEVTRTEYLLRLYHAVRKKNSFSP